MGSGCRPVGPQRACRSARLPAGQSWTAPCGRTAAPARETARRPRGRRRRDRLCEARSELRRTTHRRHACVAVGETPWPSDRGRAPQMARSAPRAAQAIEPCHFVRADRRRRGRAYRVVRRRTAARWRACGIAAIGAGVGVAIRRASVKQVDSAIVAPCPHAAERPYHLGEHARSVGIAASMTWSLLKRSRSHLAESTPTSKNVDPPPKSPTWLSGGAGRRCGSPRAAA